jgi:hypothetical protein
MRRFSLRVTAPEKSRGVLPTPFRVQRVGGTPEATPKLSGAAR